MTDAHSFPVPDEGDVVLVAARSVHDGAVQHSVFGRVESADPDGGRFEVRADGEPYEIDSDSGGVSRGGEPYASVTRVWAVENIDSGRPPGGDAGRSGERQ